MTIRKMPAQYFFWSLFKNRKISTKPFKIFPKLDFLYHVCDFAMTTKYFSDHTVDLGVRNGLNEILGLSIDARHVRIRKFGEAY